MYYLTPSLSAHVLLSPEGTGTSSALLHTVSAAPRTLPGTYKALNTIYWMNKWGLESRLQSFFTFYFYISDEFEFFIKCMHCFSNMKKENNAKMKYN